jgi:hypothetical protein
MIGGDFLWHEAWKKRLDHIIPNWHGFFIRANTTDTFYNQ